MGWFKTLLGVAAGAFVADSFFNDSLGMAKVTNWFGDVFGSSADSAAGSLGALPEFGTQSQGSFAPSWGSDLTGQASATAGLADRSGLAVLGGGAGYSGGYFGDGASAIGGGTSFFDRAKDAISRPDNWVRAGLALAGGAGGTPQPVNTQAAYGQYQADAAKADAENQALRDQQNVTATNLEESGGATAFRGAQVRGANDVEALRDKLGYSSSPTFVQNALLNKAQGRAGLNAQTAYATGDASARTAAAGMRKYAPEASTAGITAAAGLDNANRQAAKDKQADYGAIGSAFEDIFGYKKEKNAANAALEGGR